MNYIFAVSTTDDFEWIHKYYSEIFPAGQANYLENLEATLHLICSHPYTGRVYFSYLRKSIRNTPFALVYYISNNTINIVRIEDNRNLHKRMTAKDQYNK